MGLDGELTDERVAEWVARFPPGQALKMLLMHVLGLPDPMRPDLVTVESPRGSGYGVALVIDGWYRTEEMADEMHGNWRDLLRLAQRDAALEDPWFMVKPEDSSGG